MACVLMSWLPTTVAADRLEASAPGGLHQRMGDVGAARVWFQALAGRVNDQIHIFHHTPPAPAPRRAG